MTKTKKDAPPIKDKQISFYLPRQLKASMVEAAYQTRVCVSEFIRLAIEERIEKVQEMTGHNPIYKGVTQAMVDKLYDRLEAERVYETIRQAHEAGITVTQARAIEFGSCCMCGSDTIWFLPVERENFAEHVCSDTCLTNKRNEEQDREVKELNDSVRP